MGGPVSLNELVGWPFLTKQAERVNPNMVCLTKKVNPNMACLTKNVNPNTTRFLNRLDMHTQNLFVYRVGKWTSLIAIHEAKYKFSMLQITRDEAE